MSACLPVIVSPPWAMQIDMTTRTPEARSGGGWLKYTIPMADFGCPAPEGMNQLLWELKGGVSSNVAMCLDGVRINRPSGAAAAEAGGKGGKPSEKPAATGKKLA